MKSKIALTVVSMALLITVTVMAAIEFTKPTEQELKHNAEVAVNHYKCHLNMANRGFSKADVNGFCGEIAATYDQLTWKHIK